MCGQEEDTKHIVFECPVAKIQWAMVRDLFNWEEIPESVESFIRLSSRANIDNTKITQQTMIILLGAISWALWLARNNLVFNNKLPASLFNLTFQSIILIQKWSPLSKMKSRGVLELLVEALKKQMKETQDGGVRPSWASGVG